MFLSVDGIVKKMVNQCYRYFPATVNCVISLAKELHDVTKQAGDDHSGDVPEDEKEHE